MALINCRHCEHKVASNAYICPSCGGTYPAGLLGKLIWPLLLVVVIVGILKAVEFFR